MYPLRIAQYVGVVVTKIFTINYPHVLGKYRESGEELSVNTDRCPEKLGLNTYQRL